MSKLEEYGYMLNQHMNEIKKYASGNSIHIKTEYSTTYCEYIIVICICLICIILYYI